MRQIKSPIWKISEKSRTHSKGGSYEAHDFLCYATLLLLWLFFQLVCSSEQRAVKTATENWSTTESACWATEASTASKTRRCLLAAHERGRRGGPGRKRHRTEGDGSHV